MAEWKPFDLKWGRNIWYCSACEESTEVPTYLGTPMYNFCPMCGANMNMKKADECKTESNSEKPNNCEDEQTETQTETQNSNFTFEKRTMWDCYNCKRYETEGECIECHYEPKTEPQTDCGDFADRLAYERGVKHAWEVAQKVFDSTVTFYEAEAVAKQIDKLQTERSE